MERNNGSNRYTPIRRSGAPSQQQHQSSNSASSSTSSLSSSSNNNQQYQSHMDNHHRQNSSPSSSVSSSSTNNTHKQYGTTSNNVSPPTYAPPQMSRETLTQHDELIRYIGEGWIKVKERGRDVVYRHEIDQQLRNFKPFNLEEYWDQRHFQNVHVSQGQQ